MRARHDEPALVLMLALALALPLACASLAVDDPSPPGEPTANPPTETTDLPPDAAGADGVPDAHPDACQPVCTCDEDCPDHEACRDGTCHERCSCDEQCHEGPEHESCHHGICR